MHERSTEFHPDLRRVGRLLPKQVVTRRTLPRILLPNRIRPRIPEGVEVVELRPGVSVRVFRPPNVSGPHPALLWIHSGGYIMGGADPDVAVPARRRDLAGLPSAWIGVGDLDLFYLESLDYAEQLKSADVPCEVEVIPGAFHGFDAVLPRTNLARAFFNSQCAALRRAFSPK
jgi:acetyl esterase/lipase